MNDDGQLSEILQLVQQIEGSLKPLAPLRADFEDLRDQHRVLNDAVNNLDLAVHQYQSDHDQLNKLDQKVNGTAEAQGLETRLSTTEQRVRDHLNQCKSRRAREWWLWGAWMTLLTTMIVKLILG